MSQISSALLQATEQTIEAYKHLELLFGHVSYVARRYAIGYLGALNCAYW